MIGSKPNGLGLLIYSRHDSHTKTHRSLEIPKHVPETGNGKVLKIVKVCYRILSRQISHALVCKLEKQTSLLIVKQIIDFLRFEVTYFARLPIDTTVYKK